MTPNIIDLNSLNTYILPEAKATEIVAKLNADAEDEDSYKVEKKDHGFAIAVFDSTGEFILYI